MFGNHHRILIDATAKWSDQQRMPTHEDEQLLGVGKYSPSFWMLNGQVSFTKEDKWDVYFGVENIFNYKQKRVVVYSNMDTANPIFDSNFSYAPAFGRMTYVGFRMRLGGE
jgi:outer membrane receptor protein involved in Fe transport